MGDIRTHLIEPLDQFGCFDLLIIGSHVGAWRVDWKNDGAKIAVPHVRWGNPPAHLELVWGTCTGHHAPPPQGLHDLGGVHIMIRTDFCFPRERRAALFGGRRMLGMKSSSGLAKEKKKKNRHSRRCAIPLGYRE